MLSAAGLHHALVHPTDGSTGGTPPSCAWASALFWVGLGLFRLTLGLPGALPRMAGGVVLGAVTVVGATTSGLLALLCLLLGSAALVLVEQLR